MGVLVVFPLFVVLVLTNVESPMWKGIFIALAVVSWLAWGPAAVAVQVALIIGIAFKNSLKKISGTPL